MIAACGSSSASSSSHGSGAVSPQLHDDAVAFARCMRANRVPSFPDPGPNGVGLMGELMKAPNGETISINGVSVNSPAFRSAVASCDQYMPQPAAPTAADLALARAQGVRYARCMRSHGINQADPNPQAGPGGHGIARNIPIPAGMTQNSPAYATADQKCESKWGNGP